ncbi:hypothetical protein PG988_011112 [Apiospora saccharicola]
MVVNPDLSSETSIPVMPTVETNSTLSSLISSYADKEQESNFGTREQLPRLRVTGRRQSR